MIHLKTCHKFGQLPPYVQCRCICECPQMPDMEKLLEPRQVKWKRVKMAAPHCPVCGEQLLGNNSMASPYKCSCGEWEGDWMNPGNFRIKTYPK